MSKSARKPRRNSPKRTADIAPESRLDEVAALIESTGRAQQGSYRRRLEGLKRAGKQGRSNTKGLWSLENAILESADLREARAAAKPRIEYPEELPVSARRSEIADAVRDHQVVIVCGETGSGKTTQLPKICRELGLGVEGMIGHTQPRRLAARTVAERIAHEIGEPLGKTVGYKIRFGDRTSAETSIKLMTDGILLAETQRDRDLAAYDAIIVDEAHERSLNIDFLLGYLAKLRSRRPDLKIIITSATIDTERFAEHFSSGGTPAPIIEVSGRTYPVETRYMAASAVTADGGDPSSLDIPSHIVSACDAALAIDRGDVLVFLPGEREIREAATALRRQHVPKAPGTAVVPLYARLSNAEQNRVFKPGPERRIVLATNVAETSVTVPRIRFVVDPGTARINRYSPRTKTQRLEVEPISQASANQRKGRCGRVGPGICFRLYEERDFDERPEFTDPEIRRTSLASVILQMASLNLGSIEEFPFLEPPERKQIRDGYETLIELGAVDEQHELTDVGRRIARLPVDPRVARMLLEGQKLGCLAEILVLASALSVQDPRDRPFDRRDAADLAHSRYADDQSDFNALLRLWKHVHEQKERLSASKFRKACRDQFLSWVRLREWTDVHRQLRDMMIEQGAKLKPGPLEGDADLGTVHRAMLSGLLSSVGKRTEDRDYQGPRQTRFSVHPGSGLQRTKHDWLVASELVRTTKLYARSVGKIEPEWIEYAAGSLVKKSYSNPRWSEKGQRVVADEKVTLWGLELTAGRTVGYGAASPSEARDLFIHHALVEGELKSAAPFLKQNRRLLEEIHTLEAKTRRTDFLVAHERRQQFFDARIPPEVYDLKSFERWWKTERDASPDLLRFQRSDLLARDEAEVTAEAFPEELDVFGTSLEISYTLEPGAEHDGLALTVPLSTLVHLDAEKLEWLVPGLLPKKVEEIVKQLPKQTRRACGPAEVFAKEFAATVTFGEGRLSHALAKHLGRKTGGAQDPKAFEKVSAPDALCMRYVVVDERGKVLDQGRDLAALRKNLRDELRSVLASLPGKEFNRDGLRGWEFDDLPERVEQPDDSGGVVTGFPAIIDKGETVALRLLESKGAAQELSHAGLRRLFEIQARRELDAQVSHLPGFQKAQVKFSTLGPADKLRTMLRDLIADQAFVLGKPIPRTAAEFEKRLDAGWNNLSEHAHDALRLTERILGEYQWLQETIPPKPPKEWEITLADIRQQMGFLLRDGFLNNTPAEWLRYFPRYISAARARLEKLPRTGVARDIESMKALAPFWRAFVAKTQEHAEHGIRDPELTKLRWLLEEYRVSLFAQELKTAVSVSDKKLAKQLERVR